MESTPFDCVLPRIGIGIHGPYLVIASHGNQRIELDVRVVDRVELVGRSAHGAYAMGALFAGGALGGLVSLIPGGVFVASGLAFLSIDFWGEARKRAKSLELVLALGSVEVSLHVGDELDAARRLVDKLTPYTRNAPITRVEAYEDAKRRLQSLSVRDAAPEWSESPTGLRVGGNTVHINRGRLLVGDISFRSCEVKEHALRGANLPLADGGVLQAALGLLVLTAEDRACSGDEAAHLKDRVAAYEKWSGRHGGR